MNSLSNSSLKDNGSKSTSSSPHQIWHSIALYNDDYNYNNIAFAKCAHVGSYVGSSAHMFHVRNQTTDLLINLFVFLTTIQI
jgi:hypothetical protein